MVYVEARGGQARAGDHIELCLLWLCLHLVPQSGARVRFLLGSNVNTTFFRVFTPEFGAVPVSGYKVSPVLESLEYQ